MPVLGLEMTYSSADGRLGRIHACLRFEPCWALVAWTIGLLQGRAEIVIWIVFPFPFLFFIILNEIKNIEVERGKLH